MTNFDELVILARKGDAEAQQALYKATVQSVYYTIVNLINDSTQAEDLTQDVYVAVLKNLDRLSKPASFPRWINRIAANTARNYLKKHKPILFATDEQEEEAIGNLPAVGEDFLPEEYAVNQELREELMAAVRSLPEKQRMAIFLHYFEGMTVAELSKTLEVGENTVKSRLNAGRTGIAKKLAKAGVTGSAATVLGLAFRNDCMASYVPAGTRAGIWLGIESELGIAAGNAAAGTSAGAASAGASAAGTAGSTAGTAGAGAAAGVGAAVGTGAAAAAKAGIFSLLGVKIAAIVLAAAVVVGGVVGGIYLFSNDKDDISTEPTAPSDTVEDTDSTEKPDKGSTDKPKDNPYGLPEEMLSFTPFFEQDTPVDEQLKDLLLRDYGEMVDVFDFEDGTRLEYYHDGYAKLYISAETIARTECGKDPRLEVILNEADGDLVVHTVYVGSNMTGTTGGVLDHICGIDDDGNAVYYCKPSFVHTNREPSSITFMVRENEQILYTVEREPAGLSGKVDNPFFPGVEAPAAPLPTLDPFYLDLAAMPYDETVGWFGTPEFNWEWQVYVYPYGDICLAFAYGEAAGVNYVMTELDRILPDISEPLTLEQMQEIFPGGYEGEDYDSGLPCYFWYYKDCPVFIYPDDEGFYIPKSSVQYNCAEIVMANLPDDPTERTSFYSLIGMTKSELDAYFGRSGVYDTNGIICTYTYDTMSGPVYCYMEDMDEHGDDKCISVVASAPALVENFNRELDVSDLREMFGDYYKDPYTGYYTYRTIKNGGELVFSLDYGELHSDCWISYTKLGCADIRTATAAMEQWGNSWEFRDLYVAPDFEYPYRTETELRLLSITYQQLDGNGYTCEARDLVLHSSNGKTYTAYGVTDNWGNVYDLSITFDCHAMRLDWTITQSGEYADFSFEPWIAYYLY